MIRQAWSAVRLWFSPHRLRTEGVTPDYRFSLANERTFLAWLRTALALLAGGIAVDQFLTGLRWELRTAAALLLLALGGLCAVRAVDHWVRSERAMRRGEDLPAGRFPALLAVGTAVTALVVIGAVLADR
jgi:putative membrane protein